jgi:hypothetical protein
MEVGRGVTPCRAAANQRHQSRRYWKTEQIAEFVGLATPLSHTKLLPVIGSTPV